MFTPNPGVFAAGVETLTPYQKYQAYIRTRGAVVSWTANQNYFNAQVVVSEASATLGGIMRGSCWSNRDFVFATSPCRLSQHAFPSLAALNAVAGTDVLVATSYIGEQTTVSAYARNSYTSLAGLVADGPFPMMRCEELLYWQNDQAWMINPFAGAAPVTFVVP